MRVTELASLNFIKFCYVVSHVLFGSGAGLDMLFTRAQNQMCKVKQLHRHSVVVSRKNVRHIEKYLLTLNVRSLREYQTLALISLSLGYINGARPQFGISRTAYCPAGFTEVSKSDVLCFSQLAIFLTFPTETCETMLSDVDIKNY